MITLTLILVISIFCLVFGVLLKILTGVFKLALLPVKIVLGIVFGIIGFVFFSPLAVIFLIPLAFILIGWLIGKIISLV